MNPFVFLMVALLTPFGFCITLFGPVYAALCSAVYIVYYPKEGPHPLTSRLDDVFYICDVYSQLFNYWQAHMFQLSFLRYTLPTVGLPFFSIMLALWLTHKFVRKMGDVFMVQVGSGH